MTGHPPTVTGSPAGRGSPGGPRVQWHDILATSRMPSAPGVTTARRTTSSAIVYSLITITTLFSFWDLLLLGTHAH